MFSVSSTSSALQVALESLSPWEPVFAPWSFLELLVELLTSSISAVAGFLSVASLADVGCSLLGSPISVFISSLMAESASSLIGGFSSPAGPESDPVASLSPLLELVFDLLEPSSLALLSSDECGEGKLSVSELLLAPPGKTKRKQIRRQDRAYTINHIIFQCPFFFHLFSTSFFLLPNQVSLYNKEDHNTNWDDGQNPPGLQRSIVELQSTHYTSVNKLQQDFQDSGHCRTWFSRLTGSCSKSFTVKLHYIHSEATIPDTILPQQWWCSALILT